MKSTRHSPTILVVNDTPDVLELFTVLLEREGYGVVTADNGLRALELAFSIEPELVICDVVMPQMDGLDFCRRLKQHPRTADVPVLLVSALRTADEDSLKGLIAGADDYLELPFRRQELLVKVARLTERHRVERHYREIVEQAADIIYTRDMDGYLTSINEAGARFFGRPASEIVGGHLRELVGPEAATRDIAVTRESDTEFPLRSLHQLKDAQGVAHYLEGIITLVRDNKGRPCGVRGVVRDITERKRAEDALQENEARFRSAFDNSAIGMALVSPDGHWLRVNRSICEILGYSEQELLEIDFQTVTHPEDLEKDLEYVQQMLAGEITTYQMEKRYIHKMGQVVWALLSVSLVRDAQDEPLYFISQIQDITDRKRAEEALRHSEERYRELFANANDLIYTHDLAGNFTSLNKAGERITGYTREEALKMNIAQVVVPEDLERARQMIARKAAEDVATVYDLAIEAKDGRRVALELSTRLIYSEGKPIGVQGIGRDITERAEAEQRTRASMQQLETLTALATAVKDGSAVDKLLFGLANSITNFTDYRSCVVMLFTEEPPYYPRCLSHSSNVPQEYIDLLCDKPLPRASMRKLIESGVRIEVGELGFAAYYPPSHYHLLDRHTPDRYKTDMGLPRPTDGPRWYAGDELFVPLITHEGEYVGLISLDDPRSGRAPDRESVLPVVALARQITQLLAQQRSSEALAQQAEREAMVNRMSSAVRRSLDLTEIFRTAVTELGSYLGVDRCTIFMSDEEAGLARNMGEYHSAGAHPVGRDFEIGTLKDLINGIDQQGVLIFDEVATDERIRGFYNRFLRTVGVRSIMYVAIKVGDETPAAFALSTTRNLRHWRQTDIALAKAVADQTGIAIRQAQLFQKAEATSAREALINRLSLAIRASLNLPEVLNTATRELGRALAASRVHLRLHEPRHATSPLEHEYVASHAQSIRHIDVSYDDPVGQRLLRSSQTIVIDDALNYTRGSAEFNEHIRHQAVITGVRSSIDCPLLVNGRFRGTLCINQTDRVRHWKEDEVSLVESVAAQLVTGIAQAELYEMAKRARKEWETTFNAMSDGLFIFDNAGQLIRVNRAGAAMEDTWPHLLLNRHCCDILRRSGGEESACIVEQTIREGRTITIEVTPERYNRPLLVTVEPITEGGNQTVVGAVCTARDLSELRKVEAEARENQSLLMNILESAREGIYALDTEGRYQWCNSATLMIGDYKAEDLIGHSFLEMTFEGDRDQIRQHFEQALKGEPQTYETRYFTKDGSVRYALIDNAPLVVDGRTTGVLGIARDITEQKQERQRASQADKLRALGQLASGVAHDFNNALAAILGRAQLMRRQTRDTAMTRNLDIIQTAAEDAAATVRRIQTFARQSQAKEFELLEAGSLLRDAVEITRTRWENEARTRGLHYEVELDVECELHTRGTASELREVFVNLIVNAVDAMPFGGRLSISCERKDGRLRMRFKDTGMGMSEEVRERIFEPFYTTKGMQGTGLGLAVSYGIIERHGGHISVESEVGKGASFEINLPLEESLPLKAGENLSHAATASLSILVVDDEEFVLETLGDMLTVLSHKVVRVKSGRAALHALTAEHFDLVFTDLSMPEMDGWEVAREIRRRWPELLIVLVTGYGKGTEPPTGEKNLIDGVIGKPFDFDQVTETIAQVTQNQGVGDRV